MRLRSAASFFVLPKVNEAKMGLAAKLGQSINRLMEEKGISQAPQLFKMWDLDGNGKVTASEVERALHMWGVAYDKEKLSMLMVVF